MAPVYVPAASVPEGVYVVVQIPAEVSVQVAALKLPPALPVTPKVTTPPVTAPAVPLSVAVTTMPVVTPYGDVTAVTLETVGAILCTVRLKFADAVAPFASVTVTVYCVATIAAAGVPVIAPVDVLKLRPVGSVPEVSA